MSTITLPKYDAARSYDWNYEHAPDEATIDGLRFEVPACPGAWDFCGLKVGSPLGIAAGPLLNGRWLRYYAALGFDVLTYKTVRSRERACYPLPNLVPVDVERMTGDERQVPIAVTMRDSWAVSFGMPSKSPEYWRKDVAETRRLLPAEKVLVVSVVATEQPGWTIDDLANDYAQCAKWAIESGADAVEANFSCPNVCSRDGQLYQHPREAALCAERIRAAVGSKPFIVKVGHLKNPDEAAALIEAVSPYVSALAMTNSVAAPVVAANGELLFDGQPRGICGAAILAASIAQTRMMQQVITRKYFLYPLPGGEERVAAVKAAVASQFPDGPLSVPQLIGVGGAFTEDDVRRYLVAGAKSVHLATAAMVDPTIALRIRAAW
jgi:dihydroorotate dehydrogenase (NAD+) catalytic subunit